MNKTEKTPLYKGNKTNQYHYIFEAISFGKTYICKTDIVNIISQSGISQSDPRIRWIVKEIEKLSNTEKINIESFTNITHTNISLLEKIITKNFTIPDFKSFSETVYEIFLEAKKDTSGKNPNYIAQLAEVNPKFFWVSFCSIDGQKLSHGESEEKFSIQSISKAINYCIALELNGANKVHQHVGHEPSGVKFNELTLNDKGRPHNPMINSGAIMTCSLIKPDFAISDRLDYVENIWKKLTGNTEIYFDDTIYRSERDTSHRNYALAHFMKDMLAFPEDTSIEDTLNFYFQCCSIKLDTSQMSKVAATLANGGICPITNEKIFSPNTVKNCLSVMYSCGMYDFSWEYAFSVWMPAKSWVWWGLMIVVPNLWGFATFSPRLDKHGNSVRGVEFSKLLIDRFNFHNYDSLILPDTKVDPRKNQMVSSSNWVLNFIWAASQGDISEVQRGIALGININQSDYDQRTALHLAAAEGQYEMVRFLIQCGADTSALDRWWHSPTFDAKEKNHWDIVKLLEEENNKNNIKL